MTVPSLGLKLAHMRLVAAISDRGQLQQAAEDVGLTQPAASRMLGEIERLIGAPLFERHPKGMTPTDMGRTFARRARLVAAEMQDLGREVADLRQGLAGMARVGSVTGPAVGCLVPAIRRLREIAPQVEVRVDVAPSTVLLRALAEGELDFMIGRLLPESDPSDYTVLPGRPEPISFLVRRGHPLDGRAGLGLAELAAYEWVIQERGTPIRTAVEAALALEGLAIPRGVVATSSLLVMVALLAQSDAVAPTGHEVNALLCDQPVSAGFTILTTRAPIELPFYHILSPRGRTLSRAALRLRTLVQAEMGQ